MSPTPHTLILASAGSGKTHALTTRLLALVARGADPGKILATTFTRKAAGEILARAIGRACAAAEDAGERARLSRDIRAGAGDGPDMSEAEARALALTLLRSTHRLRVMTIDSFLLGAVSALAWEAGLPGAPAPIDEQTRAQLIAEAACAALAEGAREEMLALFTAHAGGAARGVHEALVEIVRAGLDPYLDSDGAEAPWTRWRPPEALKRLNADALRTLIEGLRASDLPRTKRGEPDARFARAVANVVSALEGEQWAVAIEVGLLAAARGGGAYYNLPIPDALSARLCQAGDHAAAALLQSLAARTRATHALLSRFHSAFERAKRDAGLCEFTDLPRLLARLDDRLQDVYYRLDGAVHHLLLDEFQDTSASQFAALRPMLDEALSQADPGRTVFCVGDVKQCLYEWRAASPDLLPALPGMFPDAFAEERRSVSYRSSPFVLDAVNRVFGTLATNRALAERPGAALAWAERFEEHRAQRTDRAGFAAVRIAPAPERVNQRAPAGAQQELARGLAADRAQAILAACPSATVGILLRQRKHIPALVGALLDRGVDASREGGNPVTDAPIVDAAASLLHFADHPGDTASLMHARCTPIGDALRLPDPSSAAREAIRLAAASLRARFQREGFGAALDALGRAIAPTMRAGAFARWEQMLDLAEEFDAGDARRPALLARLLRERSVEAPTPASVRVMTIHGSKGLEFDAVILPDLEMEWRPRSNTLFVDRSDPLGPPERVVWHASSALRAFDPALEEMHDREAARTTRAELSALYVAMTRAKRSLEMIVAPRSGEKPGDTPKTPSAARVLLAALTETGAASAPGAIAWSIGDERAWMAQLAAETHGPPPTDAGAAAQALRFAPARATDARSLARSAIRRPSDAARRGLTPAEALTPPSLAARGEGEVIHAWFARIEWLGAGPAPTDEALLAEARAMGAADADAAGALVRFRRAIELTEVRSALSRADVGARAGAHASIEALRERPFAVRDPRPPTDALLVGRFDRLVIARDERGAPTWAEVVDFKTDVPRGEPDAFVRAQIAHHRPQMEAYRLAASRILGLAPERIGARLVFTSLGRVVEVA